MYTLRCPVWFPDFYSEGLSLPEALDLVPKEEADGRDLKHIISWESSSYPWSPAKELHTYELSLSWFHVAKKKKNVCLV